LREIYDILGEDALNYPVMGENVTDLSIVTTLFWKVHIYYVLLY